MSPRAAQLAQRRRRLVGRSAQLRQRAGAHLQDMEPTLAWVDRVQDALGWLRGNPIMAAAGTLLLSAWRPSRAASFGARLWSVWKLFQRLRGRETPTAKGR